MKTELKKVYTCDFCKKHTLSASSTSRHEKYCQNNPTNRHACFNWCKHLIRERKNDYGYARRTTFNCGVTGKEMYSFQLEKKQSLYPYTKMLKGERMPLQCDLYKEMEMDRDGRYYHSKETETDE